MAKRSKHLSDAERVALRALQTVPNVGPVVAGELLRLGIRSPQDLAGRDPDEMYEDLALLDGAPSDLCMRDVFAAAVSYAETGQSQPWWAFTPMRKAREAERKR